MSEEAPAFDAVKLLADLRAGDGARIAEAYKRTFGNDLGRFVLTHHLQECGVGNPLGPDVSGYQAGRHDAALALASIAGFDQSSIAVAVLSDSLEETHHDQVPAVVSMDEHEFD